MHELLHPTPYADVNAILHDFLIRIQAILGNRLRGMYLSGSLALGDFDPRSSDIDFVVVTDEALSVEYLTGRPTPELMLYHATVS